MEKDGQGGSSPLPEAKRLVKANIQSIPRIGAFDDDFRDGIKGHVFNPTEAGFANGAIGFEESVKFGIVGATTHDQIDYKKVNYSKKAWAENPSQSVNYVSAHDNLTLWDKISVTNPDATEDQKIANGQAKQCHRLNLSRNAIPTCWCRFLKNKKWR